MAANEGSRCVVASVMHARSGAGREARHVLGRALRALRQRAAPAHCAQVNRGEAAVVMRKKGLHPQWFPEAKVLCNGEEVLVTSGTQASYTGERAGPRGRASMRPDGRGRERCGQPDLPAARPHKGPGAAVGQAARLGRRRP